MSEVIDLDEDSYQAPTLMEDTTARLQPLPVIPNADDLQVAAAAALGQVAFNDANTSSENSEESEGSEYDSEDEEIRLDMHDEDEMSRMLSLTLRVLEPDDGASAEGSAPRVRVEIKPKGTDAPAFVSQLDTTSEDEESISDSDEDVQEIATYEEMREMIDRMDDMVDDGGVGQLMAADQLFGDAPLPLENIEIEQDDPVSMAGHVVNCLEGTIVVKAQPSTEVLDEGSLLVNEGKQIVGVVEDIFGPVQMPMYILRDVSRLPNFHAQAISKSPSPGECVYSVDRLSKPVLEDALRVKGYDNDEDGDLATKVDETEFSDDEAEARFRKSLKAKRKVNKGHSNPTSPQEGLKHVRKAGRRQRQHQNPRSNTNTNLQQPATLGEYYAMQQQNDQHHPQRPSTMPITLQAHHVGRHAHIP